MIKKIECSNCEGLGVIKSGEEVKPCTWCKGKGHYEIDCMSESAYISNRKKRNGE